MPTSLPNLHTAPSTPPGEVSPVTAPPGVPERPARRLLVVGAACAALSLAAWNGFAPAREAARPAAAREALARLVAEREGAQAELGRTRSLVRESRALREEGFVSAAARQRWDREIERETARVRTLDARIARARRELAGRASAQRQALAAEAPRRAGLPRQH